MKPLDKLAARYPGKRILITGATSGMGEALALQFAAAGFRVAVASRNPDKVAATCERVAAAGGEPLAITLDVTSAADFERGVASVEQAWSGLDLLVNNAGVLTAGKIDEVGLDVWEQSLNTDLWSVIHGCRIFVPLLQKSGGGHIANVASAAGLLAVPDASTYAVAKAGVVSLSRALKVELADKNIERIVLPVKESDIQCEKCGRMMVYKDGRFGQFLACPGYPECKNTKSLSTGVNCPQDGCEGQMVERKTKRGKIFYGCSEYPKCNFATWDKPVDRKCPQCNYPMMVFKDTKRKGALYKCPSCRHEEPLPDEATQPEQPSNTDAS